VTVIQASLLTAVQLQLPAAVTAMLPLAAIDVVRFKAVGAIVTRHGTPAWVTVNVWPPMVMVPVRELVLVLARTLMVDVFDEVESQLPGREFPHHVGD